MSRKQEIKGLKHGGIRSLVKKAIELGMKVDFLGGDHHLIKIEYNGKTIFMERGVVPAEERMGDMTKNKELTKIILKEVGIKTPKGIIATSFNEALALVRKIIFCILLLLNP